HCRDRVKNRGQDLVSDLKQPARRLGCGFGLGDNSSHPLTREAHHPVQHVGVIWIDQMVLMGRGTVEPAWNILPCENLDDAWYGQSPVTLDADDTGMRMG